MKRNYLIILFFILLSSFTYANIEDNLILGYNLNSSTIIKDLSNNDNNGSITGSFTQLSSSSCKIGECLQSDGTTNKITTINNIGILGDEDRTISIWINSSFDALNGYLAFGTYTGDGNAWFMSYHPSVKIALHLGGASSDIETAFTPTPNIWNNFVTTYDGGIVKLYMNNVEIDNRTYGLSAVSTQLDLFWNPVWNNYFIGSIDEVKVWNRTLSREEITWDYNSGNGRSVQEVLNVSVIPPPSDNTFNTSLFMADFPHSDITFGSSTYFNALTLLFNTTEFLNLSFLSAFNIEKLTNPQPNIIDGKIILNGNDILEERLRSVSSINDIGSSGFKPILFDVVAGSHNITIQFKRSGIGDILISNLDLILLELNSNRSNPIRTQIVNDEFLHSATNFISGYNWTINTNKNATAIFGKFTVNSTDTSNPFYSFQHKLDLEHGIYTGRNLGSSSDLGTLFNIFMHENGNSQDWTILSKLNENEVTTNITIFDFDLIDSNNNTIGFFEESNLNSNLTNNYTVSIEKTSLVNKTYIMKNGEGLFLSGILTLQSISDSQNIILTMNSTNSSHNCNIVKERSLSNNNDIGNLYAFGFCGGNLSKGDKLNLNMYLNLENGESVQVIDEGFNGFEVLELDIESFSLPVTMGIFFNATNNSIRVRESNIPFNYSFSLGSFNTFNTANCSLIINNDIYETQIDRMENIDYLFNYSTGIQENNLNISLSCVNPEISNSTINYLYRVDTFIPRIESSFINLSNHEKDSTIDFKGNCSDSNIFALNVSWFDVNDILLLNNFYTNLTGNNKSFDISRIGTNTGNNFYNKITCWDDHNPLPKERIVKPLIWELNGIDLIADNNIKFSGNFKELDGKGNIATYFYLSDNKYKMKLTFNENSKVHNVILETDKNLIFRENSIHKGHFVYLPENRYIDFDGKNINYLDIDKISSNKYDIDIHLFDSSDEIELESIGDLNTNEEIYFYDVVDTSGVTNMTGVESQLINLTEGVKLNGYIVLLIMTWLLYLYGLIFKPQIIEIMYISTASFLALIFLFNSSNMVLTWLSILGVLMAQITIYTDSNY